MRIRIIPTKSFGCCALALSQNKHIEVTSKEVKIIFDLLQILNGTLFKMKRKYSSDKTDKTDNK